MGIVYSTAGEIVQDAYEEISLFQADEPVTADLMASALRRLNLLLDEMGLNRSLIYTRTNDGPLVTVNGTNGYAIGTGLTWATVKPIRIEQAWIRIDDIDYPLDEMSEGEYNEISQKTIAGQPTRYFFKQGTTGGTVYFDYVPDAVYSVYLSSWKPFTKFTAQEDAVAWPDGFEAALMYNLAVRLAPKHGKTLSPLTAGLAEDLARKLKSVYRERRPATFDDVPTAGRGRAFNVTTGEGN